MRLPSRPAAMLWRRLSRSLLPLSLAAVLGCPATRAPAGPMVRVLIPSGASFAQAADSLVAHGVIHRRMSFVWLARLRGVDRAVQAGVYEFAPGTGAWDVLTALAEGRIVMNRFTVPEGLALVEIATLAQEKLQLDRATFLAASADTAALVALGVPGGTAEGFLFPDTYRIPEGITPRELVRVMVREFQRRWPPEWQARMDSLGLTLPQVVTLASIVEGEARHDAERPLIAGVYLNRLRRRMPLQADPTVQYAILQRTGARKARLFYKDYGTPSPYNTYLHPGLPPGPINSPGHPSLQAVLFPAPTNYLYFVAGPDGYHLFSRTIREHQAASARARSLERAAADAPKR